MSIQKTAQHGGDEPIPKGIMELQQIALGMFLIYDALGDNYQARALVEEAILSDWAGRYRGLTQQESVTALSLVKERMVTEPWSHFINCRDLRAEGWVSSFFFSPDGNADILTEIGQILARLPFKDKDEKGLKS